MKLNVRKLKSLIKSRGYSIATFATAIGLKSRNGVYDIFNRDGIKTTQLQKICEVLQIDASEIISSELSTSAKKISTDEATKRQKDNEKEQHISRLENKIKWHEDNFERLMKMYERLADSYDRLSGISNIPPANTPLPKSLPR